VLEFIGNSLQIFAYLVCNVGIEVQVWTLLGSS